MKLIIASDIHGSASCAEALMERVSEEHPDRIVLLGDLLYHGPRNPLPEGHNPARVAELLNAQADRIIAVRGNCDAEVDQMVLSFPCMADYAQLMDAQADESPITLFFTHGHVFSPDKHPALPPRSAFVSGHTHVKTLEERGGVLYVNPGSLSLPKDNLRGYAVYENGYFALKSLDGVVLAEASIR